MDELSTSPRRVDSGIVLWDDIRERLEADDLSTETLKQSKNDNNPPPNNSMRILGYRYPH
jgi:hypothetical protein